MGIGLFWFYFSFGSFEYGSQISLLVFICRFCLQNIFFCVHGRGSWKSSSGMAWKGGNRQRQSRMFPLAYPFQPSGFTVEFLPYYVTDTTVYISSPCKCLPKGHMFHSRERLVPGQQPQKHCPLRWHFFPLAFRHDCR